MKIKIKKDSDIEDVFRAVLEYCANSSFKYTKENSKEQLVDDNTLYQVSYMASSTLLCRQIRELAAKMSDKYRPDEQKAYKTDEV